MSLATANTAFFGLYFGQQVESISGSFLLNLVMFGNLPLGPLLFFVFAFNFWPPFYVLGCFGFKIGLKMFEHFPPRLMLLVDLKIILCTYPGFQEPDDFPSLPGTSKDVESGPPLDVRLVEMEVVDPELLQRGCAICLGDFLPGEELRGLVSC